jgi:hypothetical protein
MALLSFHRQRASRDKNSKNITVARATAGPWERSGNTVLPISGFEFIVTGDGRGGQITANIHVAAPCGDAGGGGDRIAGAIRGAAF